MVELELELESGILTPKSETSSLGTVLYLSAENHLEWSEWFCIIDFLKKLLITFIYFLKRIF